MNGEDVDLTMRLGDSGVAYFVEKVAAGDDQSTGDPVTGMTAELDEVVSMYVVCTRRCLFFLLLQIFATRFLACCILLVQTGRLVTVH